jgi:hypothetical protein
MNRKHFDQFRNGLDYYGVRYKYTSGRCDDLKISIDVGNGSHSDFIFSTNLIKEILDPYEPNWDIGSRLIYEIEKDGSAIVEREFPSDNKFWAAFDKSRIKYERTIYGGFKIFF